MHKAFLSLQKKGMSIEGTEMEMMCHVELIYSWIILSLQLGCVVLYVFLE